MALPTIDDTAQFVTLGIDNEVFAVEVARVREILDYRHIARLPNAPAYLLGLIDVRGRGVPIIDLRGKLGLPAAPPTANTRIVVLDVDMGERTVLMGLVADRVFEVTALEGKEMEAPPDIGVRWRSDYIRGIGRRGNDFVIVFDLARLFSTDEVALVATAESLAS